MSSVTREMAVVEYLFLKNLIAAGETLRALMGLWVFGIVVLLWGGVLAGDLKAEDGPHFCLSVDDKNSTLLASRTPEGFIEDVDTVRGLVRKLRVLDIPLSFIEHQAGEPLALPGTASSFGALINAVMNQHDYFCCQTPAGRLVLRPSDAVYDLMIPEVDVVEEERSNARLAYIKHLRDFDRRFEEDWNAPIIVMGGPPVHGEERVTLSPRASLFQHLIQLLGRDEALYFDVPASSEMAWRTIYFGEVRRPPRAPAHTIGETSEKQ